MPQVSGCHGNGADHCCYLAGQVCPFLEENTVAGRRWACGLYRELGDWDLVHADPRYTSTVADLWAQSGPIMVWLWEEGVRCGNWGVEGGAHRRGKAKGNDPQYVKDYQANLIDDFNRAQQGEIVSSLCCFGNRPEV